RLRDAQGALQRGRTAEAHADDQHHQRLEPALRRLRRVDGTGRRQSGAEIGCLMAESDVQGAAEIFDPLRPRLMRVAYRMLGSVADAEDVVQEAFIRWMGVDRDEIREPEAFLRRVVTRLCLDQLKSAKHQRETYIGPWLPDPIVEEEEAEDVTLPLMLAMERLS